MKKYLINTIFFLVFTPLLHLSCTSSPEGPLDFDHTLFDFGTIREDSEPVSRTFTFTNHSDTTIVVTRIRTTCGCLTPDFTRSAVEPGRKGTITVKFDPDRLPGEIHRQVMIFTNLDESQPTATLDVAGFVERTNDPFVSFRYRIGNLRLRRNTIDFGEVFLGEQRIESAQIANDSHQNMTLSFGNVPEYLEVKVNPERLTPHDRGDIVFTFRSEGLRPGIYEHNITVRGTGGTEKESETIIPVRAVVYE